MGQDNKPGHAVVPNDELCSIPGFRMPESVNDRLTKVPNPRVRRCGEAFCDNSHSLEKLFVD